MGSHSGDGLHWNYFCWWVIMTKERQACSNLHQCGFRGGRSTAGGFSSAPGPASGRGPGKNPTSGTERVLLVPFVFVSGASSGINPGEAGNGGSRGRCIATSLFPEDPSPPDKGREQLKLE